MKQYSIVGMQHQKNSTSILAALDPGEAVQLVREPDNPYDKNAVAVWVGGSKVGYIPSKQNAVLATFIDQTGSDVIIINGQARADAAAIDVPANVKPAKAIDAKFVRSPNSHYPMVEV